MNGNGRLDLAAQVILFGMVVWLISMANSTNALLCLLFGSAGIFLTRRSAEGSQKLLNNLGKYTLLMVLVAMLLYFTPGLKESILEFLGEDVTLTGRTDIWKDVLDEPNNALLGAGYQSFWLGTVTDRLFVKYPFHPNQAHNAYIETYLNGGWIGLILILLVLATAAAQIRSELVKRKPEIFLLASFFFTATIYCWSEAMFGKISPIWLILLLAVVKAPSLTIETSKRSW